LVNSLFNLKTMKRDTLSTQEIILALASMPKRARNLLGKGKKYDAVLQEILKYDSEAEDSHFRLARSYNRKPIQMLKSARSK
jgi:hypothetical protein